MWDLQKEPDVEKQLGPITLLWRLVDAITGPSGQRAPQPLSVRPMATSIHKNRFTAQTLLLRSLWQKHHP